MPVTRPSRATAFTPPAGMRNRHVQSMIASAGLRKRVITHRCRDVLATARPEILVTPDGARFLGLYNRQAGPSAGLVILLHGWEGSAESHYMLSAAQALYDAGFDTYRLNFRDHGGTHHLNEELFHSCRIQEVVDAIGEVQRLHPVKPSFLAGFSLGGNFALRVGVRAERANLDLKKIVAICPVLSPCKTMQALESGLWVYRHYFLTKWRRSLYQKARCFPDQYDFGNLRRFRTLTETTDFFVQRHTPFADLFSYLSGYAIVGDVLGGLAVPAQVIAAGDDPVIPVVDLEDLASGPNLSVTVTAGGGHCAFLEGFGLDTWMDSEIVRQVTS